MKAAASAIRGTQTIVKEEIQLFQKRKQVGLLGGNFNPVHVAHLAMAEQVYQQLGLDKVCFMPTYFPPHKDEKQTIDSTHRLAMLELALADNKHFEVEPIELIRKGKSYTYETMKALTQNNPDTDYYFIVGGDMVNYLPTWYKIDELLQMTRFVGTRRPHYGIETPYPIIWIDTPQMDVSSSLIREKISNNCSVRYLVPDSVINYIYEKGLYKDGV